MADVQGDQPLKYTITHYRKPEHTHESFVKWIVEKHIPLAVPALRKHGVIGYSLFVTPAPVNQTLKDEISKIRPSWEFADFDLFIEYTVPSMQTIRDIMADPDWHEAIKDQDDWVDTTRALLSIGHSTPYIVNGEAVNMS